MQRNQLTNLHKQKTSNVIIKTISKEPILKQNNPKLTKQKLKQYIKQLTAVLFVILTLAITYLPGTPSWDDIYAAVGLRSKTINDIELKDLTVTFIDVGQGDSILIYTEDTSILIDTGPDGNAKTIKNVLDSFEIDKLDYLIITHNHDDHIGSLNELQELIKIDNTIIPNDTAKMSGMTLTFAVNNENKVETNASNNNLKLNNNFKLEFLAPIYINTDINNMSLVIKLTYKNTSFLLMGDAEEEEEATLLKSYDLATLKSDILKVGHHGSDSSSSDAFLQAVAPTTAVISVGADNDYGHPHAATIEKLRKASCEVHRTDEEGTLLFTTDGEKIEFFSLK